MEIQLQELIDQIRKDGVEAAEKESNAIISSANDEAKKIIENAKAEAEKIIEKAKAETERMTRSGEEAVRQASRNLLISFRESVAKEANAIIDSKVSEAYSSDALLPLIVKAVEGFVKNGEGEDVSVVLNSEDLKALEGAAISALKEKMINGVTFKANDSFDGGFRISVNDGKAYYDYSKESVTEMLSVYLSPKVTALLKEAENI